MTDLTHTRRFTRADANAAISDDDLTWTSPIVDLIDVLAVALADHYFLDGWTCRRCLDHADTMATRWARR